MEKLVATSHIDETCAEICLSSLQLVTSSSKWKCRFERIFEAVCKGRARDSQLKDHVFELKVICWIASKEMGELTYEPAGRPNGKRCDLLISSVDKKVLVEMKAVHPTDVPRDIPSKYVSPNNQIFMDQISYHAYSASYDHLIDQAFDVERKLGEYDYPKRGVMAVWLNYDLNLENFRDFVAFYRGEPRIDDPMAKMAAHKLGTDGFAGTIDEFWGFPFNDHNCGFRRGGVVSVGVTAADDVPL